MKAFKEGIEAFLPYGQTNNEPALEQLSDEALLEKGTNARKQAERALDEANQIASGDLEKLAAQGEMISNMENNVEEVHWRLNQTSRELRGFQTIWGAIANLIFPKSKPVEDALYDRDIAHIKPAHPRKIAMSNTPADHPPALHTEDRPPTLSFSNPAYQQWWDEEDAALDNMLQGVQALKEKNDKIHQTVTEQTEHIEDITGEISDANRRIQKQMRHMNKLMG